MSPGSRFFWLTFDDFSAQSHAGKEPALDRIPSEILGVRVEINLDGTVLVFGHLTHQALAR
jgi:hypothetical protein